MVQIVMLFLRIIMENALGNYVVKLCNDIGTFLGNHF